MLYSDPQDVDWSYEVTTTYSEAPEFEQAEDVNDRVDEPGGIEEED